MAPPSPGASSPRRLDTESVPEGLSRAQPRFRFRQIAAVEPTVGSGRHAQKERPRRPSLQSASGEVSTEQTGARQTVAPEREEPHRATRVRLPVRPGDAAVSRSAGGLIGSGASRDPDGSNHKSSSLAGTTRTVAPGVMQPSAIGAGEDCCDRGRSRSSRALWRRAARQAAPGAHDGSRTGCDSRADGVAVTARGPEFGPPYDGRLLTTTAGSRRRASPTDAMAEASRRP